jgi:hypothetical protein
MQIVEKVKIKKVIELTCNLLSMNGNHNAVWNRCEWHLKLEYNLNYLILNYSSIPPSGMITIRTEIIKLVISSTGSFWLKKNFNSKSDTKQVFRRKRSLHSSWRVHVLWQNTSTQLKQIPERYLLIVRALVIVYIDVCDCLMSLYDFKRVL